MPATLKVFPLIIPPNPCSPFQLSRSFISNLGRGVPLLCSPPFHPHRRRVQVPSFSILTALASPLRLLHSSTSAFRPSFGTQIPGPRPIPGPHPPQLGPALTSGAPRPQHKRRRCCSSAPDAAPASSSISSSFSPPPAALHRTQGAVTVDVRTVSGSTDVSHRFLPPPSDP